MSHAFDVFEVERENNVMWRSAAATFDEAEKLARQYARNSPSVYIILNQRTGEKTFIEPDTAARAS